MAAVAAAGIGAAGAIGGALISKSGSSGGGGGGGGLSDQAIGNLWAGNRAYNQYATGSMDLLKQYQGQANNYLQPYYDTGTAAEKQYAGALGVPGVPAYDPSGMVKATPGYQFGLSQGNDALNASLSAQGMYGSGPQRQASQKFGQNYGMNYYNQLMSQLQGLGQQGQQAGNQMGNWAMNTGQGLAALELGMGQNAQNTFATTAGMGLQSGTQNQNNSQGNMIGMLGGGLGAIGGIAGQGANYLGNLLGPLFSGAGGSGTSGLSAYNPSASAYGDFGLGSSMSSFF